MKQLKGPGIFASLPNIGGGQMHSYDSLQHLHHPPNEAAGTRHRLALFLALATMPLLAAADQPALVPFPVAYAQATPSQETPPNPDQPPTEPPTPERRQSIWNQPANGQYLSIAMDYRYPLTGDYESYYGARIFMEMVATKHHAVGMTAGAGSLRLTPGSVPDRGAHDPALFDLGFFYRLHFTPSHVLLRPYGTIHLNLGTMLWDYKDDPVSDGESYWRDLVGLADAYVGAGLFVNATKSFHLFGEMGYGGMAFIGSTHHGFKNELFDDFGYVSIKAGIGLTF